MPYWGLRKYAGNQDLIWGGDNCQHQWGETIETGDNRFRGINANTGGNANPKICAEGKALSNFCQKCPAWRGSFGLEPTIEMYIAHSLLFLDEIKRVLRKDGICFINIGDSYWAQGTAKTNWASFENYIYGGTTGPYRIKADSGTQTYRQKHSVLKPKDLCLIPFRLAIAAQERGWWVRSVIHYIKPNPMPESCKDRPSDAVEYILMLTKSAHYYFDQEAVREPNLPISIERAKHGWYGNVESPYYEQIGHIEKMGERFVNPAGRNIRNAWTFPTQGFAGAHFAVFPEELPKKCILMGTPEYGCCAKCGAPWTRIISSKSLERTVWSRRLREDGVSVKNQVGMRYHNNDGLPYKARINEKYSGGSEFMSDKTTLRCDTETQTLGWRPSCKCCVDERTVATVLDPFAGSGTTLAVAKSLGRKSIGIEISREYCDLAIKRIQNVSLPMELK